MASLLGSFPPWAKAAFMIGSGALVGLSTYALLAYSEKKKLTFRDEGFEDVIKAEDQTEKRILILGLDGAGKSTFLANLSCVKNQAKEPTPTDGFNVIRTTVQGTCINMWEIGGGEKFRPYWLNFLQDTDALVFIVDSTDEKRLPLAYDAFHNLISDDRLANVPVLVLANKQDIPEALSPQDVEVALNLKGLSPKEHPFNVLGTQYTQGMLSRDSIKQAENAMLKMVFHK